MNLFKLLTREDIYFALRKKANKNEILFQEDEECRYIGIVKKGEISISTYSLSGNEIIYNEIYEGGIFGNNLIFSEHSYYRGHVISKKDCEILLYSKAAFMRILQKNKEFLEAYLSLEAEFTKGLNGKIKLLSIPTAEERLYYFIKNQKRVTFKSIASLANTLYLTREALSRTISKLVKEGKIKRSGNMIELQ